MFLNDVDLINWERYTGTCLINGKWYEIPEDEEPEYKESQKKTCAENKRI